jgi:F420H(2)-dependent quinone reductase
MSTGRRHPFFATNKIANPILRPLLRGRLGTLLGHRLAVLRYRGRRTDASHELVVQYARAGESLWIVPGQPNHKRWWRNMGDGWPVTVWLAGQPHDGTARVVRDADELAGRYTTYRATFTRAQEPTVMVRTELSPRAEPTRPTP